MPPVLSVVVPAYNEAGTIAQILARVLHESTDKEVLIVDDGSTDGTRNVIDRWLRSLSSEGLPNHVRRISLTRHPANRGKGAAVRTGLREATGRYFMIQDADLELDPADYDRLLAPLESGEAEFVVGYRVSSHRPPGGRLRDLGILSLNGLVRALYGQKLRDEACCFKVARVDHFRQMNLESEGFECCPEIIAKACRLCLRFREVPVSYFPRTRADGKKLRLRHGVSAVRTLLRCRQWRPEEAARAVTPADAPPPTGPRYPPPVAGSFAASAGGFASERLFDRAESSTALNRNPTPPPASTTTRAVRITNWSGDTDGPCNQ
ncbi:MAG: glycosyltransferase family 2 protein [Planctomycetota bacterium]|nr:glycosyltransferase family 2 protein [Planctomycetaceae bacterium]MDQ3330744.1 glycosyltransferase family 2 protein [Planctomycetota bacterium]